MRSIDRTLRRYVAGVSALGVVALAALIARDADELPPSSHRLAFWLLAALVLIGELRPVRIVPRFRGGGATSSTSFCFALLLGWGVTPTVAVVCATSVLTDAVQRKAWFKVVFNAAQYALSFGVAGLMIEAVHGPAPLIEGGRAGGEDVALLLVAGFVFFVLNNVLIGVVVALAQDARIVPHILEEARGQAVSEPALIAMAPVFVIVTQANPAVLPLLLMPIVGVYVSANLSLQKEHQALHDGLTGLPNRTLFRSKVSDALAKSRQGDRAAMLLIDLDGFKDVNDTLGHATGDRILQQLGPLLCEQVRDDDLVARLGGDEFVAFLPRLDNDGVAFEVAERIREAVSEPFVIDGVPLLIEASIGIALYPDDGDNAGTLLRRADVAMYLAKESRAGCERYSAERDRHSLSRLSVLGELRGALDADEVVLHYQPKTDVHTGEVAGAEALVRWQHPRRGLLYPADFLPLAERSGLIVDLTDRVLEAGIAQALRWERHGFRVPVAANLSVRSLDDEAFPARITRLLERHHARPDALSLELTESMVMADPVGARRILTPLSEMGVRISIDDFGTGYSSLAYLTQLPISEIKIDRSFMARILDSPSDAIIVRSTIDLAHDLGLLVVAEGVESESVCELLTEFGCDQVQGYYVHRPAPEVEFNDWLYATGPGVVDRASEPA